ncbi:MAG: transglycosylase SLT domain-containing protein [Bacteriovoracales bacterium]|nr:transglycosylase SLT domain-containing protein [Bacteriovoracales bacterium]
MKIFLLLIFSFKIFADSQDGLLISDSIFIEDVFEKKILSKNFKKHQSSLPKEILLNVLNDPKEQIPKIFKIPHYFKKSVLFWAQIYTQFNSNQVLIHDKNNLSIIYDAIDFSHLSKSGLPGHRIKKEKESLGLNSVKKIKQALLELSKTRKPKSKYAKDLRQHLIKIKLKTPKGISRKKFFTNLSKNIRIQTGQRDKIFQGILNAEPFKTFIHQLFKHFELPPELLAIAFVESSFNPAATSQARAKGVWQIMPFIGKKLFTQEKELRSIRNIPLSTIAALHLLAQKFKILNRWDLAVTAYHSGTKHLLLARKKFRKKNIDLAYILKHYKKAHLGFASKNFYSEFLALVYILKYKTLLFPLEGLDYKSIEKNPTFRYGNIDVYVSKCGLIPKRFYSSLKKSSPYISQINNHLISDNKIYKRGTIVLSDVELNPNRYQKLSWMQVRRNYPKNYRNLIKSNKCGAL